MIKTTLIAALGGMIAAASIAVAAPAVARTGHGHGEASGATSETGGARTTAARPAAAPGVRAAAAVSAPAPEDSAQFKAVVDAIRNGDINSTRPVAGLDDSSGDIPPLPEMTDGLPFPLPAETGQ